MTDRELLELAAKAYWGEEIDDVCSVRWSENDNAIVYMHGDNQDHNGRDVELCWNPLEWDHDALRLAVKLEIVVTPPIVSMGYGQATAKIIKTQKQVVEWGDKRDPHAATRRAIVRAAAEIGRAMK